MLKREMAMQDLFISNKIEARWQSTEKKMDELAIPDGTGGVNSGDRKAIFYLINQLNPLSVLEIGTHIGASTLAIASALYKNMNGGRLVSVDYRDVNDPNLRLWENYGTMFSPAEMINEVGCRSFVRFITGRSVIYFVTNELKFDFIFIDGDHSKFATYTDIAAALKCLNKNGVVLLHDYFPDCKSLWSNGKVISGVYQAVEEIKKDTLNIVVQPLGELPWPTKLNSNVTSLALLTRI